MQTDERQAFVSAAEGNVPSGLTIVLQLGYRGTEFSGYAEQEGLRTVAGELRRALETYLGRPCELTCAGRTDAGVHALAQYVSFSSTEEELELRGQRMWRALAALTPDDISIRGIYTASSDFSARFDAVARSYRYRISLGNARPIRGWEYSWWLRGERQLDVDAMDEAARYLLGEHDFESFCRVSSAKLIHDDGRSTCRNVREIHVGHLSEAGEEYVAIDVTGNAFLHNMVRIITGTLVEVGRGRRSAEWVGEALAAKDRRAAGPTAPPQGLTLERVDYPDGALKQLQPMI